MGKLAELAYDIEQLYIEGHSPKMIAMLLECPAELVYEWLEEVGIGGEIATDETRSYGPSYDPYDTLNS